MFKLNYRWFPNFLTTEILSMSNNITNCYYIYLYVYIYNVYIYIWLLWHVKLSFHQVTQLRYKILCFKCHPFMKNVVTTYYQWDCKTISITHSPPGFHICTKIIYLNVVLESRNLPPQPSSQWHQLLKWLSWVIETLWHVFSFSLF